MIVFEMPVSNGLLIGPVTGPYELTPTWNKITIYIDGDFVSIVNLRAFTDMPCQIRLLFQY